MRKTELQEKAQVDFQKLKLKILSTNIHDKSKEVVRKRKTIEIRTEYVSCVKEQSRFRFCGLQKVIMTVITIFVLPHKRKELAFDEPI